MLPVVGLVVVSVKRLGLRGLFVAKGAVGRPIAKLTNRLGAKGKTCPSTHRAGAGGGVWQRKRLQRSLRGKRGEFCRGDRAV